jgi:signal transduction histidine kinase
MLPKKPETLALTVALAGTLIVIIFLLGDLLLSRHRDIETGERRLRHFGMMMAEHTARSFEAIDILLREVAVDLAGNHQDWLRWDATKGWEYAAQRHSRAMPQLRDLSFFDRDGDQRFVSTYFPPPQINIRDRPYFAALAGGAQNITFGPFISRNSGRFSYAVARRIDSGGRFNGVVLGNIEPAYLQEFCWMNRLSDDFEAVLINAKGEVVASCRPADLSRQSPVLGLQAAEVLFAGQLRNDLPSSGIHAAKGFLISMTQVTGFPDLRILTAIPETTLLASWHSRMLELGLLGMLITLVLLVSAFLVRRQIRQMSTMTAELAASHEGLEERVSKATLELAGQKEAAENANKAKSRFLAAASHDLRQPLHALSLFTADLQRQVRSGTLHELPRLAEQISTSTTVLGELLDSLLDISRLDVAGIQPEIRPFPLNPIFERLSNSFRRAALDRKMQLRIHPTRYWLGSDPVMIERIIANLLSNALRYTPSGGRILVAARRRGSSVLIEVRDNGPGIAKEHQAAIFAEFYQVGNAARERNKGLGLGLSIVDRLARALDVPIGLDSRPGDGTRFTVTVPISRPPLFDTPAALPPSLGKVHFIGRSETLKSTMALVASWDYTVCLDDSETPRRAPTDAVLVVDAEQAAAVNAELAPGRPLIVLSNDAACELPFGAHALPVPIRPAKLRALINQLQKTFAKLMP